MWAIAHACFPLPILIRSGYGIRKMHSFFAMPSNRFFWHHDQFRWPVLIKSVVPMILEGKKYMHYLQRKKFLWMRLRRKIFHKLNMNCMKTFHAFEMNRKKFRKKIHNRTFFIVIKHTLNLKQFFLPSFPLQCSLCLLYYQLTMLACKQIE